MSLKERIERAMVDYVPPTLEQMVEEGSKLFPDISDVEGDDTVPPFDYEESLDDEEDEEEDIDFDEEDEEE